MADRPVPYVGLGDLLHGDGGLHPHIHLLGLQGVCQGQGVDHRGQHSHVVSPSAVHLAAAAAPPKGAAAHYNGDLCAQFHTFLDAGADPVYGVVIQAEFLISGKGFAAEFEQDSFILQCHSTHSHSFILFYNNCHAVVKLFPGVKGTNPSIHPLQVD